jgi:hypothetical protein
MVVNVKWVANMKKDIKKAQRGLLIPPRNWKQDKMYNDYMNTTKGESFNFSTKAKEEKKEVVKKESSPKQSSAKKSTEQAKKPGITPKMGSVMPSKINKSLDIPKREAVDISYKPKARTYSDSEKKMMSVMEKGKKADGTMKESAQRKIQAIRTKERLATQKIRNKAERAEKRYEVKSAKDKVKAVRKSFKK